MNRIFILLLIVSTSAYTQGLDFITPRLNIGTGNEILFTQPSTTDDFKTWRYNSGSYSGTITVPNGYTAVKWWLIQQNPAKDTVALGTSLTVTWTPVRDTVNTYALLVKAHGKPGFADDWKVFPGEVTVKPPVPTSEDYDESYNLASGGMGDHDGGSYADKAAAILDYNPGTNYSAGANVKYNGVYYKAKAIGGGTGNTPDVSPTRWKIKSAYVVRLFGSYTGTARLLFYWYNSSDILGLPIQFYGDNAVIRTTRGVRFANIHNVIIDGTGVDGTYGLDIGTTGSPTGEQRFVWDLVENAFPTRVSGYVAISGVKIDNGGQVSGATTFQITADQTGASNTNNWDNYQVPFSAIDHIYALNSKDELFYLAYTNDLTNRSPLKDFLAYYLIAENGGNEGIQFSSFIGKSEVFKCIVREPGINNNSVHRNAFQFGGGNQGTAFYMNDIETSKNIHTGSNGSHGNNSICFSNKITSTGRNASDGVNFQWTLEESTVYSTIEWAYFHNTVSIRNTDRTQIPLSVYRSATTTTHDKLRWVANLTVTNTSTQTEFPGGYSPGAQFVSDSKQYTNSATPLFVDYTNKDYKFTGDTSPAFGSHAAIPDLHWLQNFDFEGYMYRADHPVAGCHSQRQLFTGN